MPSHNRNSPVLADKKRLKRQRAPRPRKHYGAGLITRPQVLLLPQMFWRRPSSCSTWL